MEGVCDMRCDVISFGRLRWVVGRCGVGDHDIAGGVACWRYVDTCLFLQTIGLKAKKISLSPVCGLPRL